MRRRLSIGSLRDPVNFVALGFGSGLSPWAPGTAGSILAILPCWLVLDLGWHLRLGIAAAAFVIGIFVCGASARRLGVHDHPAIVFDEIAAMLTAVVFLPNGFYWLLVVFVLFRFFDIVKPWPIRDLDHRLGGGLGIMLDDQMAAVYTTACVSVIEYYFVTV